MHCNVQGIGGKKHGKERTGTMVKESEVSRGRRA